MKRIAPFLTFLLYIAAVCYLCFAKFDSLSGVPHVLFGIPFDKIVHFCMFFPFPLIIHWMIGGRRTKVWKSVMLVLSIFLVGIVIAAATELIQGQIPYRSADPLDFKADALALAISSFFVTLIENHKLIR